MSDTLELLLELPEHCRLAARLIRDHPDRWCQGCLWKEETDQRCGIGWVVEIGGYGYGAEMKAITIVNSANRSATPEDRDVPFAVFNDRTDRTPEEVADRLELIAAVLDPTGPVN